MPTHSIDVDDEVYARLAREAKPLVDTPNTVLRRLLGLDRGASTTPADRTRKAALTPLLADGRLMVGQALTWRRRNLGQEHTAFVTADGKLRLDDGTVHDTPSGACSAAAGVAVNGWSAWRTDKGVALQELRHSDSP
ncbi:hypothetical protein ACF061_19195 [Streptomyces sp. NPDC015220]|uniref:restriction system modified-DNA reader domain-containing protein n=1 Tax=Streptomyces sp. NPDC015220 TaxID=3364947 RepID=UPI0036FFDAE2